MTIKPEIEQTYRTIRQIGYDMRVNILQVNVIWCNECQENHYELEEQIGRIVPHGWFRSRKQAGEF